MSQYHLSKKGKANHEDVDCIFMFASYAQCHWVDQGLICLIICVKSAFVLWFLKFCTKFLCVYNYTVFNKRP